MRRGAPGPLRQGAPVPRRLWERIAFFHARSDCASAGASTRATRRVTSVAAGAGAVLRRFARCPRGSQNAFVVRQYSEAAVKAGSKTPRGRNQWVAGRPWGTEWAGTLPAACHTHMLHGGPSPAGLPGRGRPAGLGLTALVRFRWAEGGIRGGRASGAGGATAHSAQCARRTSGRPGCGARPPTCLPVSSLATSVASCSSVGVAERKAGRAALSAGTCWSRRAAAQPAGSARSPAPHPPSAGQSRQRSRAAPSQGLPGHLVHVGVTLPPTGTLPSHNTMAGCGTGTHQPTAPGAAEVARCGAPPCAPNPATSFPFSLPSHLLRPVLGHLSHQVILGGCPGRLRLQRREGSMGRGVMCQEQPGRSTAAPWSSPHASWAAGHAHTFSCGDICTCSAGAARSCISSILPRCLKSHHPPMPGSRHKCFTQVMSVT